MQYVFRYVQSQCRRRLTRLEVPSLRSEFAGVRRREDQIQVLRFETAGGRHKQASLLAFLSTTTAGLVLDAHAIPAFRGDSSLGVLLDAAVSRDGY